MNYDFDICENVYKLLIENMSQRIIVVSYFLICKTALIGSRLVQNKVSSMNERRFENKMRIKVKSLDLNPLLLLRLFINVNKTL